jgi:hypothetical protein
MGTPELKSAQGHTGQCSTCCQIEGGTVYNMSRDHHAEAPGRDERELTCARTSPEMYYEMTQLSDTLRLDETPRTS